MANIKTKNFESFEKGTFTIDSTSLYKVNPTGADVESKGFFVGGKDSNNLGSLAAEFEPRENSGDINIVENYPWTMTVTKGRSDIPFVKLKEYRMNENAIARQSKFFAAGGSFVNIREALPAAETNSPLDVYDELFPRDNPTGWRYTFPYFSKSNIEINTAGWKQVDGVGQAVQTGVEKIFGQEAGDFLKTGTDIAEVVTKGSQLMGGGVVNIFDRPKVFNGHDPRSIKIEFPLYNTATPVARDNTQPPWLKNKNFLFLFANQNLFNKRDLTTGISPVFYEVLIPGQFYSVACAVTNFSVTNEGAVRTMYTNNGKPSIVPDAYQVSITLSDLVMPSRNTFQASDSFEGYARVTASKVISTTLARQEDASFANSGIVGGFVKKTANVIFGTTRKNNSLQ